MCCVRVMNNRVLSNFYFVFLFYNVLCVLCTQTQCCWPCVGVRNADTVVAQHRNVPMCILYVYQPTPSVFGRFQTRILSCFIRQFSAWMNEQLFPTGFENCKAQNAQKMAEWIHNWVKRDENACGKFIYYTNRTETGTVSEYFRRCAFQYMLLLLFIFYFCY